MMIISDRSLLSNDEKFRLIQVNRNWSALLTRYKVETINEQHCITSLIEVRPNVLHTVSSIFGQTTARNVPNSLWRSANIMPIQQTAVHGYKDTFQIRANPSLGVGWMCMFAI